MPTEEFVLVLIKPDAKERGLVSEIFDGLKAEGLCVEVIGAIQFDLQLVLEFYEWEKLDYPEEIRQYVCVDPLPIWIVSGDGAIEKTMSIKVLLRTKYYNGPLKNLFHCPCSQQESQRQYELIYPKRRVL